MACHPNFPILLIIKLLEPIESPKTKSNRNMVREILFSTFAKIVNHATDIQCRYP